MSLLSESFLYKIIKFLGGIFCRLPYGVSLGIARGIGFLGFFLMAQKRAVVEANLRIAFSTSRSRQEIRHLTRQVFENFVCSFLELLCLPRIKKEGFEKTVALEGKENITQALSLGKGCIFLAIHSGSWELASLVGSMCEHPYNIVANEQRKAPKLNELLNDYRRLAGAKVIPPGSATREIIRVLKANEIVSLVLDQGGKDGIPVDFFGKTASMSTGAIRLGLKYQTPICPVWIKRETNGKNVLKVFPMLTLQTSKDVEKDVMVNTQKAVKFFEDLLRVHPYEYMWSYKVYKYSTQTEVLILDDSKTGHLRQSQAVANSLKVALNSKVAKQARIKTQVVEFKYCWSQKVFAFYCLIAQVLGFLRKEGALRIFLKANCYQSLVISKPDFIVACGSQVAGVSFILSRTWPTQSIHILKPGVLDWRWFSLIVLPQHDKPSGSSFKRLMLTKVALNLITVEYLKQQEEKLLLRYSHLKGNVRSKIGVLIGGNTKGVVFDSHQIRLLVHQLKDAAKHFNMDLLVTTSRRTPKDIDEMLTKELRNFERCPLLIIANDSNIPEAVGGILALSDLLVVSGESISMISEAVSSGKKTIVFSAGGNYTQNSSSKYDRFVLGLNQQGYLLASSIKDLSVTITQAMSQKAFVKAVDDQTKLLKAIEDIL
ncbi:MAG: ELM1/GtrOC1 family putative glycosyltransferase [Candidatus Omnitrophota bacterium]